jgi:hypothetical protein
MTARAQGMHARLWAECLGVTPFLLPGALLHGWLRASADIAGAAEMHPGRWEVHCCGQGVDVDDCVSDEEGFNSGCWGAMMGGLL